MNPNLLDRLKHAIGRDPEIVVSREDIGTTTGQDPRWLADLGLEKRDLIRLQRKGFAIKAHYQTKEGPVRVRWIIFKEAVE